MAKRILTWEEIDRLTQDELTASPGSECDLLCQELRDAVGELEDPNLNLTAEQRARIMARMRAMGQHRQALGCDPCLMD